jgi:hypothetical protein
MDIFLSIYTELVIQDMTKWSGVPLLPLGTPRDYDPLCGRVQNPSLTFLCKVLLAWSAMEHMPSSDMIEIQPGPFSNIFYVLLSLLCEHGCYSCMGEGSPLVGIC